MTWTSSKPTDPGWYWFQSPAHHFGYPHIVHLVQGRDGIEGDGWKIGANYWAGQWAGPLEPPKETGG